MSTDQIEQSLEQPGAVAQTCGFCRRPIEQMYFHLGDRVACGECGNAVVRFVEKTRITNAGLTRGALAAIGAAVACAIGWATVTRISHAEWGIIAAMIGFVTARAALKASGGQRGTAMQLISAGSAVFGIALGKVLLVGSYIADVLSNAGKPVSALTIGKMLVQVVPKSPSVILGGFDFVWMGIAVFSAWKICKPVQMRVAGPFGTGVIEAPPGSAIPYASPQITAPPPAVASPLWRDALLRTGLSMIISAVVYTIFMQSWMIAVGFVLLILVHEMGHVIANVRYGVKASLPLFIPFIGAVITLREKPANAWVEAVIGIAGPIAGTLASFVALGWYLQTGSHIALVLAWFGFTMNLFNMLPLPPLDGGRVAAAISPWIWILGLAGLGGMVYLDFRDGQDVSILMILLVIALPRVLRMLKGTERGGDYYNIGWSKNLAMGALYLALLAILAGFRFYTHNKLGPGGFL